MSIFHIINFNKKLILDFYFCLKSGPVFLFQIFIIAPSASSAWNEGQPLAGPKFFLWASKKLESLVQMAAQSFCDI